LKNTKTKEEESSARDLVTDFVTDGRKKSEGSRLMEVVKREYFHNSPPLGHSDTLHRGQALLASPLQNLSLTESIQDTSPRIHPWRNKKPVSDTQAPEFIRVVNASI
jgi:hypothetical protein